jgi:hypothetical protein
MHPAGNLAGNLSLMRLGWYHKTIASALSRHIGHEASVGLSVFKVHMSATRWRLFTFTAVALRSVGLLKKRHLVAEIYVGQLQRA